jgi:hypothetical protein
MLVRGFVLVWRGNGADRSRARVGRGVRGGIGGRAGSRNSD